MTHVIVPKGLFVDDDQNKSRTEPMTITPPPASVNIRESDLAGDTLFGCAYVVRAVVRGSSPFCGLPAVPRSAYCARHRLLCVVGSGSAAGRALAETLAAEAEAPEPPPELSHLLAPALPEPQAEERPDELRSLLDHPPPSPGTDLPE